MIETPGVQDFIQAYRAKFGILPTQRSFFAYEATNLVVDAIGANSDKSEDIERALKTTTMPSLLGGSYAMDAHNHPHTPMQIVGVRGGKATVIAQVDGGTRSKRRRRLIGSSEARGLRRDRRLLRTLEGAEKSRDNP